MFQDSWGIFPAEESLGQKVVSFFEEISYCFPKLNDIETKKAIQRSNETRSWFFEEINNMDKPLTGVIKKKEREDPNK